MLITVNNFVNLLYCHATYYIYVHRRFVLGHIHTIYIPCHVHDILPLLLLFTSIKIITYFGPES